MTDDGNCGAGYLTIWVIYDHPKEFPNHFVVRQHHVNGMYAAVSPIGILTATLDEAREQIPQWLHNLGRYPDDDPKIVECWM